MTYFCFSQFKCLWNQNWPCHNLGQGQPRGLFYINFVVLQSLMLLTYMYQLTFQAIGPKVLEKTDFLRFLSIFEHGGHLGHVTLTILTIITFFYPILASYEIHFYLAVLFLRKMTPKFYHNLSITVTLAKVTKCPWPLAFINDGLDFISIL